MFIDPNTPLYNTIIFYILFITLILITKPEFMYSNKQKRFKAFGCGKDQTLFAFPLVCVGSGIALYTLFLLISIFSSKIS